MSFVLPVMYEPPRGEPKSHSYFPRICWGATEQEGANFVDMVKAAVSATGGVFGGYSVDVEDWVALLYLNWRNAQGRRVHWRIEYHMIGHMTMGCVLKEIREHV